MASVPSILLVFLGIIVLVSSSLESYRPIKTDSKLGIAGIAPVRQVRGSMNSLKKGLKKIGKGIRDVGKGIKEAVKSLAKDIKKGVKEVAHVVEYDVIDKAVKSIRKDIKKAVKSVENDIRKVRKGIEKGYPIEKDIGNTEENISICERIKWKIFYPNAL
ncbi:UNVERIFIED_CONTAM: hypothetical protein RMT77_015940 [Armadillidium vulgare]